MKFSSVAVATLSCVMLTTLFSHAQDKKAPDTYLLKLKLSKTLTQEITVTGNDEFHVSTTDGNGKWLVEGKTEIVQEAGQPQLMQINLNCKKQPSDPRESPSLNQLMTMVAVPSDTEFYLQGGPPNKMAQGHFRGGDANATPYTGFEFQASIKNVGPQSKNWLHSEEDRITPANPKP